MNKISKNNTKIFRKLRKFVKTAGKITDNTFFLSCGMRAGVGTRNYKLTRHNIIIDFSHI